MLKKCQIIADKGENYIGLKMGIGETMVPSQGFICLVIQPISVNLIGFQLFITSRKQIRWFGHGHNTYLHIGVSQITCSATLRIKHFPHSKECKWYKHAYLVARVNQQSKMTIKPP